MVPLSTVPMNTESKPKTAIKLAIYACTGEYLLLDRVPEGPSAC